MKNQPLKSLVGMEEPGTSDNKSPVLTEKRKEFIRDDIAKNRQCPICWGMRGGAGVSDGRYFRTRYYVCDRCGHSWKLILTVDEQKADDEPRPA